MEIPYFESEEEEREFWAAHDSADYADTATPEILEYCIVYNAGFNPGSTEPTFKEGQDA